MDANGSSKTPDVAQQYLDLCHAMQSGVAVEMQILGDKAAGTTPKSLRVGVNTAMSDHGALVELLIRKGVITRSEYDIALRDWMRREVKRYEKNLSEATGQEVTLA